MEGKRGHCPRTGQGAKARPSAVRPPGQPRWGGPPGGLTEMAAGARARGASRGGGAERGGRARTRLPRRRPECSRGPREGVSFLRGPDQDSAR